MELIYLALGSGALLAALVWLITPAVAVRLKRMGITGTDIHKAHRPDIPERGGIVILVAAMAFLAVLLAASGQPGISYVLVFTAALGFYGLADDSGNFGKYKKAALLAPLAFSAVYAAGFSGLWLVPAVIFFMGLSNVFNLFAGFNGMEAGCSSIALFFMSACCFAAGMAYPLMLSIGMLMVLAAFLAHNRYPAKIFPGNVGTMTIGGFFASVTVYYGLYAFVIPLMSLYIIDMALKACSSGYAGRAEMMPTHISRSGMLVPRGRNISLAKAILRLKGMDEAGLVGTLWKMQAAVGVVTFVMVIGGII
jgi:UDP-N-acetylglucosamine--dolichyl-phosphate N-acetylglucosaminephosphotransferase